VRLIDGRAIAAAVREDLSAAATALIAAGTVPTLSVLVPTDDEATDWYVRSIERAAKRVGVECRVEHMLDATGSQLGARLAELSLDPSVHGIICQTPMPAGVALHEVAAHIAPAKDIDGANPTSLGRLAAGLPTFAPATAAAVMEILRHEGVPLSGSRVVVVGRSTVVGKPAALLLIAAHATVTVCHSRTVGLADVCAEADILVAAAGKASLIGAGHVKPGAVVIDVGTNPTPDGGLAGDVDQEAVSRRAAALTPVPGGVGPVTTSLLLRHAVLAAQSRARRAVPS
jgi:methylenetetrahydrofolate dehydrogenase (NADP+)/methenyltetrahydrofolate cyclohydrolase